MGEDFLGVSLHANRSKNVVDHLKIIQKAAAARAESSGVAFNLPPSLPGIQNPKRSGGGRARSPTNPHHEPPRTPELLSLTPPAPEEKTSSKGLHMLRKVAKARLAMGTTTRDPFARTTARQIISAKRRTRASVCVHDSNTAIWEILREGKARDEVMALPNAKSLKQLPIHLQETFLLLASETLVTYLYPRALLWLRTRERKRLRETSICRKLTLGDLSKQGLFRDCATETLQKLIDRLELVVFQKDEYLIHEGEQIGSGIYFIAAGKVAVWKKKQRANKRVGRANGTLLVELEPITCVGEYAFLTEEPRMASCQAASRVETWVLKKTDFNEFIKDLPEKTFGSIIENAFATRNRTMHMSFPITEEMIARRSVFAPCPRKVLSEYITQLEPFTAPKNYQVTKGDMRAERVLFLQNGRCGVIRSVPRRLMNGGHEMVQTHVHTLKAPCVIGDTAVLYEGVHGDSIVTLSTCDFWVLNREDFAATLKRHQGIPSFKESFPQHYPVPHIENATQRLNLCQH